MGALAVATLLKELFPSSTASTPQRGQSLLSTPLLCVGVLAGSVWHRSHAGNHGCGDVMGTMTGQVRPNQEDSAHHLSTVLTTSPPHPLALPFFMAPMLWCSPLPEGKIFQPSLTFTLKFDDFKVSQTCP